MVICLEQSADLHLAQLMPLPLTFSCFSKIQIGFTFLVPARAFQFVIRIDSLSESIRFLEKKRHFDSLVVMQLLH